MVTVIIVTCNRVDDLARAVESVRRSRGPKREIIVVDNGSADDLGHAVRAENSIKVIRFENSTELSACRNAGIDMAQGDAVAFTDDDCLVAEDWIERIAEDLCDCDAIGGVVQAATEFNRPWWWNDELNWIIGLSPPGFYGPLAGITSLPQTANLAYRTSAIRAVRFSEGFCAPLAKNMTREDCDLWTRTLAAGYTTGIDHKLVVYHKIHSSRLRLNYCIQRAFADGFAAYVRECDDRAWKTKLMVLLAEPFRIVGRMLSGSPGSRTHDIVWVVREYGYVYAHARMKTRSLGASSN